MLLPVRQNLFFERIKSHNSEQSQVLNVYRKMLTYTPAILWEQMYSLTTQETDIRCCMRCMSVTLSQD